MSLLKFKDNSYGREFAGFTKSGYVLIGVVVAFLLFLMLCFRTVDAGKVGIITRFGEVNRTVESGATLKLPFIESLKVMDTRTQRDEQTATAATADQQIVDTKIAVNYSLQRSKAIDIYKNIGVDYQSVVLANNIQAAYKGVSAKYTAIQLLTKRSEVELNAKEALQARLAGNPKWQGVIIENLSVVDFGFSKEFDAAIEAKQVAQQNAEKAKQDLARIEVEAQQAIAQAKGQAESQRLLNQTASDKTIALKQFEVQQQAIAKWNGVLPTTQAGTNSLFNIPTGK